MDQHQAKKTGQEIANNVTELTGNTPIVRINRLHESGSAEILAKLELFSPTGSVKDRVALNMIERAEEEGLIQKDTVIIEPSSGNTGIGLAMICAARGYRCIIVIPDSMSLERIFLLRRFGAEVVLTPAREDIMGAVRKAEELAKKHPKSFVPFQFKNPWNPDAHRRTTALEILQATGGKIDAFVAGIGTGGTITGVGQVLKERVPGIRVIAVEPARSAVLAGGKLESHRIQGIGAGFIPEVLDRKVIDEVRKVADKEAFDQMKLLASQEGILAGISAGAAFQVSKEIARELGPGKRVVTVFADTGERYLTIQHYFEF
ncbi:MAG: cysteine synthase A [Deltaproteobacteria bacterium]|nr:cysteine synthase A [Deltaproteobacteria bacterium]MDQ3295164.1 cysteine synthase A [Myxococcota bacterium]